MKKALCIMMALVAMMTSNLKAVGEIEINDIKCDFNNDTETNVLDFLALIGQAEPGIYRIEGKTIFKSSGEMPPFGAATRHGYVDSIMIEKNPLVSIAEKLRINKGKSCFKDVCLDEIRIWWVKDLPGFYQDVFITLAFSPEEDWSQEELSGSLICQASQQTDLNGDGITDHQDIALFSKAMQLPIESDPDPTFISSLPKRLSVELRNNCLITTWGKLKLH